MARGRRYDKEPKLNIKKVFGVAIAFIVFIMIIISLLQIVQTHPEEAYLSTDKYY